MIEVNNLTGVSLDKSLFEKVAKNVLKREKKTGIELSLALVDQARIKELNKKYRGKNRVTDVLSFTGSRDSEALWNGGEIIICPSQVKKNAEKYQITFKKELVKVLIHGILHVLGYEHEKTKAKADKMRKKEEYYFSLWQNPI